MSQIGAQYQVNLIQIFFNYSESRVEFYFRQWLNFLGQNDCIFSFSVGAAREFSTRIRSAMGLLLVCCSKLLVVFWKFCTITKFFSERTKETNLEGRDLWNECVRVFLPCLLLDINFCCTNCHIKHTMNGNKVSYKSKHNYEGAIDERNIANGYKFVTIKK